MQFDPENKVVKLCAKGMQLEAEGKTDDAYALFEQAWHSAENDFEAFTAAHYVARNQKNPNDVLKWNLEALNRANAITGEELSGHYPSLYLNVGKSYETLGNITQANSYYQSAAESANHLPPGKYSDMIRGGISAGLNRTGTVKFSNAILGELIDKWCARKDLRPLSLVLPAYVGNLGAESDINKLVSALSYLSATRCLAEDEQQIVDGLVAGL